MVGWLEQVDHGHPKGGKVLGNNLIQQIAVLPGFLFPNYLAYSDAENV